MHRITACSTFAFTAFALIACGNRTMSPVEPAAVTPTGVSADVRANAAFAVPDGDRGCRALTIPLDLTVRAGDRDFVLSSVSMRFLGAPDVPSPQTTPPAPLAPPAPIPTSPAPIPTTQFGSELIAARSVRTIALALPIGCATSARGTVVVVLGTRDGAGRRRTLELRANVG